MIAAARAATEGFDLTDDIDVGIAIRELVKAIPSNTMLTNEVRSLLSRSMIAQAREVLHGPDSDFPGNEEYQRTGNPADY